MAFQTYNVPVETGLRSINAVAVTSAGTTTGSAIDLTGSDANAYAKFAVVFDWSGLDASSTDELYRVQVQGATSSGFGTTYILEEKRLGASGASANLQPVSTPASGRVVMFCDNIAFTSASDPNSLAALRYVRVVVITTGTTPAITMTAWLVPMF